MHHSLVNTMARNPRNTDRWTEALQALGSVDSCCAVGGLRNAEYNAGIWGLTIDSAMWPSDLPSPTAPSSSRWRWRAGWRRQRRPSPDVFFEILSSRHRDLTHRLLREIASFFSPLFSSMPLSLLHLSPAALAWETVIAAVRDVGPNRLSRGPAMPPRYTLGGSSPL